MNMKKEKTITDLLAEIAAEICNKYCKYPDACEDVFELHKQYCQDCPVNRI